ncbi:MAG: SDR family oxidoreductase [Coriobacteriia bacterium]|nr:SDR family oxidoreductase [Coriobacteriia bacterium]
MSAVRILVVGASGMLGHEAIRVLVPDFDVHGACRTPFDASKLGLAADHLLTGLDATDPSAAYRLLETVQPDVVLNAVGIVKQRADAKAAVPSIQVNSLWPHILADACDQYGARMVHVSTDCVFSGSRGGYVEDDVPDAFDVYGRSKLLGEVTDRENVVTLRTSIIGWQIGEPTGLVGWFAAHRDQTLKGFTRAVFSGLTTRALAEVIRDVVLRDSTIRGLWHVSADPIDKFTLLSKLSTLLDWEVDLTPSDELVIDRSLDCSRFRDRTGWTPPSWDEMLEALATEYEGGR